MMKRNILLTAVAALGVSALLFHGWTAITYAQMESVEKLFIDSPVDPSSTLKVNITHADAYAILNCINEQRALQNSAPLALDAKLLHESERASYKCDDPNIDKSYYISDQIIILHGPQTAEEVVAALFNNPEHKKHILDRDITEIGIGHTSSDILVKTEDNKAITIEDQNTPIPCWAICLNR